MYKIGDAVMISRNLAERYNINHEHRNGIVTSVEGYMLKISNPLWKNQEGCLIGSFNESDFDVINSHSVIIGKDILDHLLNLPIVEISAKLSNGKQIEIR